MATNLPVTNQTPRAGRCAIIGKPNVGKSTLLNALLGQKLVIATSRPGTTRSCVLGVYTVPQPPTQIAFVDTPGLERPKSALERVLSDRAKQGLVDCDVVLLLAEVSRRADTTESPVLDVEALRLLESLAKPVILAINKIDLLKNKEHLLPLIENYRQQHSFAAVVPISAQRGTNLAAVITEIRDQLPEGSLYDDPEFLTDRPERFFVSELIREAAMAHSRQEVPQGIACVLDHYEEQPGLVRIEGTLIVNKESHKGILVGARGDMIKAISTRARQEIERFLGRKVYLRLVVKSVPGWTRDPQRAKELSTEGSGQ